MTTRVRFDDGALVIDGVERLLLAGEYPYYRDIRERWPKKLARMREAGIEVVTFYVPWRHHLVAGAGGAPTFVFSGAESGSRDVLRFLALIAEEGLFAIVKPGPFVHGEIQLGGLPDHVSPSIDPTRAAALGADGAPICSQGRALPCAVCPTFEADVSVWLSRVWEEVIVHNLYPRGPVIAVQLGNEGIYSDAALDVTSYDYAAPAARRFRAYVARKYRAIEAVNASYGTSFSSFASMVPPCAWPGAARLPVALDWGTWASRYLDGVWRSFRASLGGSETPVVVNLPTPAGDESEETRGRLDAWLSRARPEQFEGIACGFTSWAGNAMYSDAALLHGLIATKRLRGPNLETNWGHLWTDAREACPITPVYHALLSLAAGATGIGVYTAVATDAWGPHITLDPSYLEATLADPHLYDPPYCPEAPIGVDGAPGPKFPVLRLLTQFLRANGRDLLACAARPDVNFACHAASSHVAAWSPSPAERYHGMRLPLPASETLTPLLDGMVARGLELGLVGLESLTEGTLAERSPLVVVGGFFMSAELQDQLAGWVERGGTLVMLWESPLFDEELGYCETLQDRLFGHRLIGKEEVRSIDELDQSVACRRLLLPSGATPLLRSPEGVFGYAVPRGAGRAVYLDVAPSDRVLAVLLDALGVPARRWTSLPPEPPPFIAERVSEQGEIAFFFALSRSDAAGRVAVELLGRTLELELAGRCCAVVKVVQGRLAGCFVKGINEVSGAGEPVLVRYAQDEIRTDLPCDLSAILEDGDLRVEAEGRTGSVPRVTVTRPQGERTRKHESTEGHHL